jgi:hypothetical protein
MQENQDPPTKAAGVPGSVRIARVLFYLMAATWLVFAIVSLMRLLNRPGSPLTPLVVAILMFGNVAAMALAGVLLGRPRKLWHLFALAVVLVNIVLTFPDELGLFDLLTLIVDLLILVLLLVRPTRNYFWSK